MNEKKQRVHKARFSWKSWQPRRRLWEVSWLAARFCPAPGHLLATCALGAGWGGLCTLPTTGCGAPRGRRRPFSDMVLLPEAYGPGVSSKGLKTLSLLRPRMLQGRPAALFAELCACVACGVSETGQLALSFFMYKMGWVCRTYLGGLIEGSNVIVCMETCAI